LSASLDTFLHCLHTRTPHFFLIQLVSCNAFEFCRASFCFFNSSKSRDQAQARADCDELRIRGQICLTRLQPHAQASRPAESLAAGTSFSIGRSVWKNGLR
jgi:hypothetical protein